MKKKNKKALKARVYNNELSDDDKKSIAYAGIIRPCIYLVIFLTILIFSLCYDSHLLKFAHIMFNTVKLSDMVYVLYYLVLAIGLFFALISLSIGIYNFLRKDDKWLYKVGIIYDFYSFIINTITIIFFILVFMFTPCVVSGASMNPTLNDGDRVILWDINSDYNNNDIIVFSGNNYVNDDIMVIKRVVAKPGDKLRYDVSTAKFYVNDEYIETISLTSFYSFTKSGAILVVPENKYVVFGDNRGNSKDSRYFGMIDSKDIYGKVLFRIYPINKISLLS